MKAITVQLIQHIVTWPFQVAVWIGREGKHIWITLAVLALIVISAFLPFGMGEKGLRVAGFSLEFLGIGVVAIGLYKTRKDFERPGIREAILNSWKRRPKLWRDKPAGVTGSVNVVSGNDTVSAFGSVGKLPATLELEERVALLEERLNLTDTQIDEGRRKLEEEVRKREAALNAEAKARTEDYKSATALIEKAVVDGISLEAMGVAWMAFGLTLSSLSEEIAWLISKLAGT
jgi:hypothetical protein